MLPLRPLFLAAFTGLLGATLTPASADPLSKTADVDFYRDTPSRSLKGLATRSDGRIVAGPVVSDLAGGPVKDILWSLAPAGSDRWLVGSGPEGKIHVLSVDVTARRFALEPRADLEDAHVFAVLALGGDRLLAGTGGQGGLTLIEGNRVVARLLLPVDSVLDLLAIDDATVLAATGNPGRIYRIDLALLSRAGLATEKLADADALAAKGATVWGEVRDRNLRRLSRRADGSILAGSAPRGNVYAFAAGGGNPTLLIENRDAEITDILSLPSGDTYATVVFSPGSAAGRITRPSPAPSAEKDASAPPIAVEPAATERFAGRSSLVWLPANGGFPETLASRAGVAFYRLQKRGPVLIIAAGEQGELVGYDLVERRSLTFAGSASTQLNALLPLDPDRLLALRNNSPGFTLVDFSAQERRELETRRIDLGTASTLGALRFDRVRGLAERDLGVSLRTSFGSDDLEGWSAWEPAAERDAAWRTATPLRGRYARVRISVPASLPADFALDRASLHHLPQNRRPVLSDFRFFSPNLALVPGAQPPPQVSTTLGQILNQPKDNPDEKRRAPLLNSPIVPAPGMQLVYWSISDSESDAFTATFSLRREGDNAWTDVAVDTTLPYAQFDTSALPDGLYFTRLVVRETSPRPAAERLSVTFETDDLRVDRSPPAVIEAKATVAGDTLVVTIHGRDALSLLEGAEFRFNSGLERTVEQPADGIRDGREEHFVLEIPRAEVAGASSVEVSLYDAVLNRASVRLTW
jgi:hypothetical protein